MRIQAFFKKIKPVELAWASLASEIAPPTLIRETIITRNNDAKRLLGASFEDLGCQPLSNALSSNDCFLD